MLNPKSFKYMHLLTETRKPVMFCIAYLLQKEQARIVQMADFFSQFCALQCNIGWAGNGNICGPDSDIDGYPDAPLPCIDNDKHCREVHSLRMNCMLQRTSSPSSTCYIGSQVGFIR